MSVEGFFEETLQQSRIKSAIVTRYFDAWSTVIISKAGHLYDRVAYIDLFSGPGFYADGTPSTPLLIIDKAIRNPKLRERLVTIFNDKDPAHCDALKAAIDAMQGIDGLKYKPQVDNEEVGSEIVGQLGSVRLVPTVCFIDPWGYKGLSLDLVNSVLKDWACECIFFFNYKRINSGLSRGS
ncbi:MAG: three-Cys-motif partner protein TcmP [Chloroflexi bacterium]|nr:three-Cys-motif partner protein TcmP [Chloroflexota bacterium]